MQVGKRQRENMSQDTPKSFRLHIGIFGRRNVGKSSLLNAIVRQQVSIVSEQAGTTTDPVEKPMELLPLGPVVFIDTAGVDDVGALGDLRIARTRQVFDRTDLGVIVTDGAWGPFEGQILAELRSREIPVIAVFNKADLGTPADEVPARLRGGGIPVAITDAVSRTGLDGLREAILDAAPQDFVETPVIAADLVGPGGVAVLVVPIDKEAPKGRIILPQVQTIRDLLDHDGISVVVREHQLGDALAMLRQRPALVVTDSQAFAKVAAETPPDVPMTSFSILYSRLKGDLVAQTQGLLAVEDLRPGDRVLVAEACSHHPIGEDIGRVKIPRWLNERVGGELNFTTVQGRDFPDDPSGFKLVIHCGACMWNRRQMLSRLMRCHRAGVPITNYGLVIAYSLGILERALGPFAAARAAYAQRLQERQRACR